MASIGRNLKVESMIIIIYYYHIFFYSHQKKVFPKSVLLVALKRAKLCENYI